MGEEIEARRTRLMDATEALLSEQGYDAVRLRDIAKRAGVSIGLIQHYFETREGLLLETLSTSSWRRAAEWSSFCEGIEDPALRMHAMLKGSVTPPQRCIAWMNLCSAATRHPDLVPLVTRIYDAWLEAFRTTVDEGVASGAFRPIRPTKHILDTIMAIIDGQMVAAGLGVYGFDHDRAVGILEDAAGHLLQHDFRSAIDAAS